MKREINCQRCWRKWAETRPGRHEQIKFAFGLVRDEMLHCDGCNEYLLRNTLAVAVSIWSSNLLDAYRDWEGEYLELVTETEADAIMRLSGAG